jgi:glycosyltransferase involved in cell wall biosynthesis
VSGRVLITVYHFPPLGGIGVQRTLKYITYLPKWGWQPSVLTPRNPAYTVRDPSLLAFLAPDLEVNRTGSFEPGSLPNAILRVLSRPDETGVINLNGRPTRAGLFGRLVWKSMILWGRIWNKILFPDGQIGWVRLGARGGRKACRRERFDVIYSTAPPISAHLIAGRIKRSTSLPWVADFRDPWIGNPFVAPLPGLKGWMQRRMERAIVSQADRVVLATDALRDMYVERYPDMAHKFVYIPNGYDRNDMAGLTPVPGESGCFTILFAGSLYRRGELEAMLGGVEMLVRRRPDLRRRLRIQFLGQVSASQRRVADEFTAPGRIADVVRFDAFVPRRQALARMAGADALLQLMTDEPGTGLFVGGKLIEYLAFDRPILAVMPHGEGRRLVDGLPCGRSADVDPGSIADMLEDVLDNPPAQVPSDPTGRYDRVNLAGELAQLLDEVAATNASRASGASGAALPAPKSR